MISRLYRVELLRLSYRRAARALALLLVAVTVITFAVALRNSRDVSDAQLDRIRQESIRNNYGSEVPEGFQPPPEEFYFDDPRFVVRNDLPEFVLVMGVLVAVGSFVLGATAGGADWSSGTVQALLFWEPRRVRVILAKAAALATVVVVFAIAVQALSYGLGAAVASARGTFDGADGEFWRFLVGRSLRLAVVAGFTSLVAFGIAGFTRNTGAALGAAFAYFAILENLVRGLRPRWQPYLLTENVDAFVRDGARIQIPLNVEPFYREHFLSGKGAGLLLGFYLAVILGVLTVSFARRDVT